MRRKRMTDVKPSGSHLTNGETCLRSLDRAEPDVERIR